MFISVLDLFKIGIGPSSSHTMGPMLAAVDFRNKITDVIPQQEQQTLHLKVTLRGSLAYTGVGHATDRAVLLGLHGYQPQQLTDTNVDSLVQALANQNKLAIADQELEFHWQSCIVFDQGPPLTEHPNGMVFQLRSANKIVFEETYFSIGGGFICTLQQIHLEESTLEITNTPYPFDSAKKMLAMANDSGLSIAEMKRHNEVHSHKEVNLNTALDTLWQAMANCVRTGLSTEGVLPGSLKVQRRAKHLHAQLISSPEETNINDWLCAYAMAVNEENAAGHMVVTAPTNGAAGVIPAVLYYCSEHKHFSQQQIHDFLLSAAAIGGIIKHRSSISGAEVGCQGEVGSAAAMAAAGLCAALGGTPEQVENAAEIALEHHLGMTCDPVGGLVQIPCIERNGFGAIKAYTAGMLALRGSGQHLMPLDNCIAAMKQTGLEMSEKYKETSLGGLAVNLIEC